MSVTHFRRDGGTPSGPPGGRVRRFTRSRRTWGALAVASALVGFGIPAASFADNPSGCDFAATGTTQSCSGPLAGSTFAGGDGNLLTNPTTFGSTDWQSVAGRNTGIDLPSGTGDNAFGQGTKEDDPNVSVVTGSIPPQKSDLTRFYEASEFANNSNFLYLAWERTNNLGSANMDFEINQKTQPDLTTTGQKTLNRTAGDLLVTFDFTNGGGRPTLSLLRWLTSANLPTVPGFPTNTCLSANSFPCWGDQITLNSSNSIGAVNNLDAVTDPFAPGGTNNIGALRFGEAAINLTAVGVFPPGTCEAFGSAFLKSRSSASFPAEVKDFVAPVPVNISNCGEIKIIKHTDPRGVDQPFSYTSDLPIPGNTSPPSPNCTQSFSNPSSFTLNDKGNTTGDNAANTQDCTNVPAGTYHVTETVPTGWQLESLVCDPPGNATINGATAAITVTPNSTTTCTYQNKPNLGAIVITKTGKYANCSGMTAGSPIVVNGAQIGVCTGVGNTANLKGATFKVTDSQNNPVPGSPVTTGNDGTVCIDNLAWSGTGTNYLVSETSPPNGYAEDPSNTDPATVTVTQNAKCSDSNISTEAATATFNDVPLTDITATATSEVPGATNSTISCVNSSNADVGNSPQGPGSSVNVAANGLKPGTYTCTIAVDP